VRDRDFDFYPKINRGEFAERKKSKYSVEDDDDLDDDIALEAAPEKEATEDKA